MGLIKKFDVVMIVTTKNVRWISTDKGTTLDPKGRWSVVEVCSDGYLVLCKDTDMVRIPSLDVNKIGNFDLVSLTDMLNRVGGYVGRQERKEEAGKVRPQGGNPPPQ